VLEGGQQDSFSSCCWYYRIRTHIGVVPVVMSMMEFWYAIMLTLIMEGAKDTFLKGITPTVRPWNTVLYSNRSQITPNDM
jgi:hypothetical protein